MSIATSKDGTTIAFDATGTGPTLVLVGGASQYRAIDPRTAKLAELLTPAFTVVQYDRRGRGDSGDTEPYAIEREVEDIEALIDETGGSALLFGMSSGGVLALDAAAALDAKVTKLAIYEPPFVVDDSRPPVPADYVERLDELTSTGHRSEAVEMFMAVAVGMPSEYIAPMKADPFWHAVEAVAPTLAYDGRIMGGTMSGGPLPTGRWAGVLQPTLVIDGGASQPSWAPGTDALAALLANAERRTLADQDHDVAPEVLSPVLMEFFTT